MNTEKNLIEKAESAFVKQLSDCADILCDFPGLRVFTVTGPTCSGKTTAASLLIGRFEAEGRTILPISVDDFYYNNADIPRFADGRPDFDSVRSIDLDYLGVFLDRILTGKEALLPHFDFIEKRRTYYTPLHLKENEILLIEGIQTMYPEVRSFLPPACTRSVAIMPTPDETCPLGARDVRLLRRLVRDERTRGSDASVTLDMWDTVAANEDVSILPFLPCADFHINSYLFYELSVIRPMAEKVLSGLPDDSPYRQDKERLLAGLSGVTVYDPKYVPADSLFREFIGKAGLSVCP